jgi:hypothetical protein
MRPGRNEMRYSHVPQHPMGIRDRNDRNDAAPEKIPEVPTVDLVCLIGHTLSLAYVTRKI